MAAPTYQYSCGEISNFSTDFRSEFDRASRALSQREAKVKEVYDKLENHLTLIGEYAISFQGQPLDQVGIHGGPKRTLILTYNFLEIYYKSDPVFKLGLNSSSG